MTKRSSGSNPHTLSGVTVSAPAKINLVLRILDRRHDGYHNLWSIMQTIALEDELQIRLAPHRRDIQLRCDTEQLAGDRSNLVCRAAVAVLEKAQRAVGLDIQLSKRIPMGAGLGGGSSDAAATILGLNQLLELGWSGDQMAEVGQPLGSDVPFFLFAPSAVVAGRGEIVKPVSISDSRWVVLVNPGFEVETKWAYQELTMTRGPVRPLSQIHVDLDRQTHVNWAQLAEAAENDFETPVFARHDSLRRIKQVLLAQGAELALLSGSGATVFGLFHDQAAANQAQAQIAHEKELKVYVVPTCSGPLTVR
ncbi:MAG TPA: 4-(cytidine 5'-diphospho)-2-C-methyl-D-erythritol kinase [Nitrospira sp.]|nr:4-(cytidine 5'-diphospho)-2-C-methyl-D-erythritol kinase [Nitrospira sp.]